MRERMRESLFWQANNALRRRTIFKVVGVKEAIEISWQIYGATIYFSDRAYQCKEQNGFFMIFMGIFLIIGCIKVFLLLIAVMILIYIKIRARLRRRNQQSASKSILRSLALIKYSALDLTTEVGEEECSICFCEFGNTDVVTKLDCNEKHVFHTACISDWIKTGKNSCPICRATINSNI